MTFQDRALPLAERGFRVFPLIPGKKQPVKMASGDHFDAATTDPEQIRLWNTQEPNANVGLSPDENFCFLETDDEAALKAACADIPPEVWDTTRAGANPNRCAFYYRQTMRTRRAGNMTATREGQENLFEFKQHRMIMTGPGSVHKNGNVYKADWKSIPAMPDVLLNRLCELYGAPKPGNTGVMSEEVKQQTELLDRFLTTFEVATTGDWFNYGKQWLRPIECPWRDTHENSNQGTSTCIVYTEGGGYGFDCKHRCSSKGWKAFRAEVEGRFPERNFSFVGDTGPEAVIGNRLPLIAHATLAEAFLRDNHDFCAVYDAPGRPTAQWVKTRWDVSGDDTILWRAVADYLKAMHDRYPAPEKGPDSRMRLYDATFINGVVRCVKPYLPPVKAEMFDSDPYMLGLPSCRVIDLRTSAVRDMRREDYISQRIDVTPDPNCPTPRFDRFISEITCGDGALAAYSSDVGT